jgi:hypothetical protein
MTEPESEYLYEKKIDELRAENDKLVALTHPEYGTLVRANTALKAEIEILRSRQSQYESTMLETMRVSELKIARLREALKINAEFLEMVHEGKVNYDEMLMTRIKWAADQAREALKGMGAFR